MQIPDIALIENTKKHYEVIQHCFDIRYMSSELFTNYDAFREYLINDGNAKLWVLDNYFPRNSGKDEDLAAKAAELIKIHHNDAKIFLYSGSMSLKYDSPKDLFTEKYFKFETDTSKFAEILKSHLR